jgi:hypothetical protein
MCRERSSFLLLSARDGNLREQQTAEMGYSSINELALDEINGK